MFPRYKCLFYKLLGKIYLFLFARSTYGQFARRTKAVDFFPASRLVKPFTSQEIEKLLLNQFSIDFKVYYWFFYGNIFPANGQRTVEPFPSRPFSQKIWHCSHLPWSTPWKCFGVEFQTLIELFLIVAVAQSTRKGGGGIWDSLAANFMENNTKGNYFKYIHFVSRKPKVP